MKLLSFLLLLFLSLSPLRAEKIVLVAGGGSAEKDAPATECALREPFAVEFTPAGEMVIVEMSKGERVLKVGGDGVLRVLAGTGASPSAPTARSSSPTATTTASSRSCAEAPRILPPHKARPPSQSF